MKGLDDLSTNEYGYEYGFVEMAAMSKNFTHILDNFPSCEELSLNNQFENFLVTIIVPLIFGIIVIIGLFGNALVVIVVLFNQQMRSTTNILIINLAIADLLFIVFCVPFTGSDYALSSWPFGDVWCRIVQYLIYVCAYASIYTLILMSLDRFLAVVHPVQSMSVRTVPNAFKAICILWITILIICIPAIFFHKIHPYSKPCSDGRELLSCSPSSENHSLLQIIFFITSYVMPLALVFILYLLMLKRLWCGTVPGCQMSCESVRCKKRVTRLVVVVVLIFAVCWGPIQVILALRSLGRYLTENQYNIIIQITSQVLAYINSCINPILYAFLSENFRKAFRKVILCKSSERGELSSRRTINEISVYNTKSSKLTNGNV